VAVLQCVVVCCRQSHPQQHADTFAGNEFIAVLQSLALLLQCREACLFGSVLQCIAVCCSVFAVCYRPNRINVFTHVLEMSVWLFHCVLQCFAELLQCREAWLCLGVLQVCCSVEGLLQCT